MIPEDDYREWIRKSADDLESAHVLANNHRPLVENACYFCQQSVEKALKGFLVYHSKSIEHTHDLINICNSCESIDNTFKSLLKYCKYLNKFISITRYPSKSQVNEDEVDIAIKFAEKVLNFVRAGIEKII